jgi:2-desacetyl-2-hydroxyethyl bacteriochlorophyllide A dehydrogenase
LTAVRQLVFHGPRRLTVEEAEAPSPGRGEITVSVHSVGVCGSDVHGYAGVNSRRVPGMVMGHEAVGTVAGVGDGVEGLSPGDRVAINPLIPCSACEFCQAGDDNVCESRRIYGCILELPGAYADAFRVRAANAVPFLGEAPLEWGALVEPLSVGARGAKQGQVGPETEVLVIGGGPIGIGAALAARRRGASQVVVSEPQAHRRALAEQLGFETFDPSTGDPLPNRFPIAIECVGHSATLAAALGAVPPKGTVVFVGLAEETVDLPATPLMTGERVIIGSSAYSHADFRETTAWVAEGETDLSPIIEKRVDLDGLPAVFAGYADGSLHALKTVLQPRP